MTDMRYDGSIQEYGVEVTRTIAAIVALTTGGNVRLDLQRDGDEDFAFAVLVNDVEWCTCHYKGDSDATLVNHEPLREALKSLGLR